MTHAAPAAAERERVLKATFDEHVAVAHRSPPALCDPFSRLVEQAARTVHRGNKILLFGNGGSAADAQHIATELTVRFERDRAPIPAMSLATDTSALTAILNDMDVRDVFARQLEAIGQPGDLAIGISTSGRSANVVRALARARTLGMTAAALSGRDGGELVGLADPLLVVPSDVTARIQEIHILIGHAFCAALETALDLR